MKLGDLVKWRPSLPFVLNEQANYGIGVEIIIECLVGVIWSNSNHVYMESVGSLEVINESR